MNAYDVRGERRINAINLAKLAIHYQSRGDLKLANHYADELIKLIGRVSGKYQKQVITDPNGIQIQIYRGDSKIKGTPFWKAITRWAKENAWKNLLTSKPTSK